MGGEKIYGIRIKVSENGISIIWGGDAPDLRPGVLNKDTMKLELSVTRIFHKVLNKGKKELLEIFEKNDFEVLGNMLFKILLTEEAVRSFLYGRLALITRDKKARCRIFIDFDDNAFDLAALPWEYLLIQKDNDKSIAPFFWGADRNSQFDLIRSVTPEYPQQQQPEVGDLTSLNVILIINNPRDKPVDKLRMITCLEKLRDQHQSFNLYSAPNLINSPFYELKARLCEYLKHIRGPYVLHILGHAHMDKDQSGIFFTDKNEEADEIKGDDFADLFEIGDENYRLPTLIVLQACESGQVGEKGNGIGFLLAKKGIPAVVAMQNEVTEDASENFIKQFYLSLLKGEDIARAVTRGRSYMAVNYNKDDKDPDQHYSDNTFGSPVVFISAETPFYLLASDQKDVVKKNAKKCNKCGFRYEDTSLEICVEQGGRCGGILEPLTEMGPSVLATDNPDENRAKKITIDESVPRTPSAN